MSLKNKHIKTLARTDHDKNFLSQNLLQVMSCAFPLCSTQPPRVELHSLLSIAAPSFLGESVSLRHSEGSSVFQNILSKRPLHLYSTTFLPWTSSVVSVTSPVTSVVLHSGLYPEAVAAPAGSPQAFELFPF